MNYGQRVDTGYDPVREDIYPLFTQYFNNPTLTKIKDVKHHTEEFSIYMCKSSALLGIEYRYITAVIYKDDNDINFKQKLSSLPWITLQTRTLPDEHNINVHSYIPSRQPSLMLPINLYKKTKEQFLYNVEGLPLQISLICKTGDDNEYAPKGNIINAIETYQTIISWK